MAVFLALALGFLLGRMSAEKRAVHFSGESPNEITDFREVGPKNMPTQKAEFIEPDTFSERYKKAETISDLNRK